MARVICTLEYASASINGVRFSLDKGQMLSDEVSDEVAANFASIPGYKVLTPPATKKPAAAASAPGKDP